MVVVLKVDDCVFQHDHAPVLVVYSMELSLLVLIYRWTMKERPSTKPMRLMTMTMTRPGENEAEQH
jgi:hypothetical protein